MRLRHLNLTFTALLVPLDFLALFLAGIGAYILRYSRFVTEVRPLLQNVPLSNYLQTVVFFALIWMLLFAMAGLYSVRSRRAWAEFGRIALACTAGTMILISTVFFRRELATSRFIVLAVWFFSILLVMLERSFLRIIRYMLLNARVGHRHIVIIGGSKAADRIAEEYQQHPILGYTVVKQFTRWDSETKRALDRLRHGSGVDAVLLADPDLSKEKALDLIAYTESQHIAFHYLADLFAATFTNIDVSTTTGVPVIEVKRTPLDGWGRIAKRAFDVLFALFFIILSSPLTLLSILLILIEDGWPVVFLNERVGEGGRLFNVFKLRSMYQKYCIGPQFGNQEKNLQLEKQLIQQKSIKSGPVYKIDNDPRVMKVGNFIRRWSIDELPQFWNVLLGDMSIVGPRPHQPREVEKYAAHHRRVLAIRPGITGMAQISGRSDLEFEDEVRLDSWYIDNWSLLLDIYIVLKTPFVVLLRRGSY